MHPFKPNSFVTSSLRSPALGPHRPTYLSLASCPSKSHQLTCLCHPIWVLPKVKNLV